MLRKMSAKMSICKSDPVQQPAEDVEIQVEKVEELAAAGPDQKNWRGIGIALLVIVCVCALIAAAIVLLTPGDKGFGFNKTRVSLAEVLNNRFSPNSFNGSWISDHEFLFQDTYGAIGIYDIKNTSEQIVLSNVTMRQHSISMYEISPDRKYLLLRHKFEKLFRYTFRAAFMVYNISNDHLGPLFPETPNLILEFCGWGPTGNQLVYVLDSNVYYKSDVSARPRKLSSSGVQGIIFNGIPDWVYEEEILSSNNALYWSKDGKRLSFVTFNDTDVDVLQYPHYGAYNDINNVYPEIINLKYPKPGKTNPTVSIWVADLTTSKYLIKVTPPVEYKDQEYYFTKVQFVDTSTLSVTWLKRSQNTSIISLCEEKNNWACKKNLQEDASHGWVEIAETVFSADGQSYFLVLPGPEVEDAGRFMHVCQVDVQTAKKTFLTSGKYDVISIIKYDEEKQTVFYMSTLEGRPDEKHVFGVTVTSHETPMKTTCYSCDLGPECLYNQASFSEDSTYYALSCMGPDIPRVEVRSVASNEIVKVLETNDELRAAIEQKAMPTVKYLQVPIHGGYEAKVRLFLPPGLREYEITKYPMLVLVYGGPNSQMVKQQFEVSWGSYLASSKNIIFAQIDGRGSGNRGQKFLFEIYRRLGTAEIDDQIEVANYLKNNLNYIDGKRIAIFGWSYGGFASALALSNPETVFSCGISVAPVTNWMYYDSVYTERYMQMPTLDDNLVNYKASDVMSKASNFKGKKYLLVHGTADDNVHLQQSMMLAKALTDAGVIFRMQVYPDENHALGPVKTHLYQTINDFLDQCYSENLKDDAEIKSPDSDS